MCKGGINWNSTHSAPWKLIEVWFTLRPLLPGERAFRFQNAFDGDGGDSLPMFFFWVLTQCGHLQSWRWRRQVSPKRWCLCKDLHGNESRGTSKSSPSWGPQILHSKKPCSVSSRNLFDQTINIHFNDWTTRTPKLHTKAPVYQHTLTTSKQDNTQTSTKDKKVHTCDDNDFIYCSTNL